MIPKLTLFLTLLAYSIIVSQSFMYMLALKNVSLNLGYEPYTELRKLIDGSMRSNFTYVVYSALLLSLLNVILHTKQPGSLVFITAAVAFVMLLIDTLITLKGNIPLNNIINQWTADSMPSNWMEIRAKWLQYFQWRQIASITGFVALLMGAVFGK